MRSPVRIWIGAPSSSRTTYRSRRRFFRRRSFAPSLLLSKRDPLRWARVLVSGREKTRRHLASFFVWSTGCCAASAFGGFIAREGHPSWVSLTNSSFPSFLPSSQNATRSAELAFWFQDGRKRDAIWRPFVWSTGCCAASAFGGFIAREGHPSWVSLTNSSFPSFWPFSQNATRSAGLAFWFQDERKRDALWGVFFIWSAECKASFRISRLTGGGIFVAFFGRAWYTYSDMTFRKARLLWR